MRQYSSRRQTSSLLPLLALVVSAALGLTAAQDGYDYGQATWYDSISQGYCGYFNNIPSNGYVAAWPYIETGPPGSGQGFWQPGLDNDACGKCLLVSCVPRYVESADGSIYLDRTTDCRDVNLGIVVQVVDECRCSDADRQLSQRGNFNWCCNVETPRLKVNRHIDLSKQAFTQLVRDGDFGRGILGIRWRRTSCDYIGLVTVNSDGSTTPIGNNGGAASGGNGGGRGNGNGGSSSSPSTPPSNPPTPNPPPTPAAPSTPAPDNGSGGEQQQQQQQQQPSGPSGPSGSASPAPGSNPNNQLGRRPFNKLSSSSSNNNANAQKLPAHSQCGGTSGECEKFGGKSACIDGEFPGYTCDSGLQCVRQNRYYWQCWSDEEVKTLGSGWTVDKPAGVEGCGKTLGLNEQCGGKGGNCQGSECADQQRAGVCCESDTKCERQNEWYWECR